MYLILMHLSNEAIAQDPERLSDPEVVGPFDTEAEAEAFAQRFSGFYRAEVQPAWSRLTSQQDWIEMISEYLEDDEEVSS